MNTNQMRDDLADARESLTSGELFTGDDLAAGTNPPRPLYPFKVDMGEVLRSVECSYSGMLYGDDKAGGPSEYTRGWGDCLTAIKSTLAAKGE